MAVGTLVGGSFGAGAGLIFCDWFAMQNEILFAAIGGSVGIVFGKIAVIVIAINFPPAVDATDSEFDEAQ